MDDILDEVRELVSEGVKEIQIIEQELTYYGVDLYGKPMIAELINRMADIDGVKWIRLHYAYPNQFPLDLLDVMRERDNVCKYLDIALQHISDHMLQLMHRHVSKQDTLELLKTIRERVPGITLRTTLMVASQVRRKMTSKSCSTLCVVSVLSVWVHLPIQKKKVLILPSITKMMFPLR